MESKSEDTVVFDNWYTSFSLFFFFQYYKITSDVSTNFQKLQWVPFLCVSIPKLMFVSDIVSKRFVLYLWIPEIIADTDYTVLWLAGETFLLVFFLSFFEIYFYERRMSVKLIFSCRASSRDTFWYHLFTAFEWKACLFYLQKQTCMSFTSWY